MWIGLAVVVALITLVSYWAKGIVIAHRDQRALHDDPASYTPTRR